MQHRIFTEKEARALTAMAIREGLIRTDEPCCICGSGKLVVRHHPDLIHRPLFTRPVCREHHQAIHLGMIPDPGTGQPQLRRWQRSPEEFDAAIRRGAAEGRRPKMMPIGVWQQALAERGLERAHGEAATKARAWNASCRSATLARERAARAAS